MAEYIDREKVMAEINRIGGHNLCGWDTIGVKALIDRQPTEDVVPRSEVEKYIVNMNAYGLTAKRLAEENEGLKKENEILSASNKTLALSRRGIEAELNKAKQEVAREIFEKAKKRIHNEYNDLSNIVPTDDDYYLGKLAGISEAEIIIDELKKKYIGEVTENE